jgi:hypothetical protein
MSTNRHLFFLMNHVFMGFGLAVMFGIIPALLVWKIEGANEAATFTNIFFNDFRGQLSVV